jgi:hypothetical protein
MLAPFAVNISEVVEQFNMLEPALFVILIVGAVMSWVIEVLTIAVQPFAPVTVTVYTPELVTFIEALAPRLVVPVLQE